ncbi:hypothetical protein [Hyella patelloides]|nr:hypothetical protein [Hyella patelloides]
MKSHILSRSRLTSAGMGGLQQTTDKCWQQNIKPEKSPLSTPAEASSAKERPKGLPSVARVLTGLRRPPAPT